MPTYECMSCGKYFEDDKEAIRHYVKCEETSRICEDQLMLNSNSNVFSIFSGLRSYTPKVNFNGGFLND